MIYGIYINNTGIEPRLCMVAGKSDQEILLLVPDHVKEIYLTPIEAPVLHSIENARILKKVIGR